ncbi:MAG TPA: YcaO-like family protein [Gaiella sp.]|jgi:ribosomal protein S12 methylthiotransferase accessory factor|nr:YcaO-like family protein [Gaiella sp.]
MTAALDDEPFTPLADALTRLEAAVSPLVGIATRTLSTTHTTDETSLPNCACELAPAHRTLGGPTVEFGSGAHPDGRRARAAAIGEAIERYSGVFLPFERLHCTTARAIGAEAVRPGRFALFHPSQFDIPRFPLVPFTEDTPTTFVRGLALDDGSPVFLPAELVYLRRPDPTLASIAYATSSGLACGPTFTEAVLGALLELVERDAVMLAWKCRLSLPLLDWSADSGLTDLDRRFFASTGLRFSVVDASVFLDLPIAISVLHGPPGSGAVLAVGAAAAAEIGEAWLRAISESFGVYRWLRQKLATESGRVPADLDAIESFDDHMLFYSVEENAGRAAFLDASPARRPTSEVASLEGSTSRAQIEALVARLARHGVSAYAADVTPPDVRELGLSVARVIAPELCALDVSHRARFLGGTRLTTAAHAAGLVPAPLDVSELNPLPHPFP